MTNGRGKSDSPTVPVNSLNKAEGSAEEAREGRELAKGNSLERNAPRTQSREGAPSALERVGQAATGDRKQRFTALYHHIYDVERLRTAYLTTKKDAAAGHGPEARNCAGVNNSVGIDTVVMTIEIEAGASQHQLSMKLFIVHVLFQRPALEQKTIPD